MTIFPEISRRARDKYHNLQDDDIMKNIFNSGRHKDKVGMQIPAWMIIEEMKHTEHYRMYTEVFGIDVPLTQSQPNESTHGTHRKPSAPRRSTRLTPPAPMPNVNKADEMILQDTLQVSFAKHKSHEEQEARENVALVNEHLSSEEIDKMVEGQENVVDDSSILRNDESNIPGTRIEPRSDKESPKVEIAKEKEVEISKEKEVELTKETEVEITQETPVRREKGKIVKETRNSPIPTPMRSPRIHTNLVSSDTEKLQELTDTHTIPSSKGLILERQKAKEETERLIAKAILQERGSIQAQISTQIENAIANVIPSQVDASMKFERNTVPQTTCRTHAVRPRDQDDPHDDAHPEGENSNQEQDDDFDFWTDSYASDDDEIPTKQVSQDIMEEVSLTIDEAKLRKMADEMLRQRCTSGDEHQYHIDQMKNFLKSDIVWESRKEILVSPHPRKTTPLVHSCQQDPEAPALSLINQDLLYLKKGNSGPEKIVLSLHKFPAVIFNDDDIEERTSRWVNKCVRKFNPYARYGVEHWKNPHAKIFYIRKQKEPGKPKEEVYSNSKIIQVVKTYWELGHEHKFITEIVARRANKYLVSITEPDYKNLNKNDIEDIYLLIMNGKVPDYADTGLLWSLSVFIRSTVIWERVHDFQLGIESYQQKVNLTAPTMTFPGIEDHEMFSIIYEPVHGIIYKNSKKEKRVMRHSEIHKFCDATLNRVLEGLKSYNNDIKYGYVQKDLTKDEAEYLKLFEEEIEERLKHRRQMRRWEMFVNGRPLGPRRERPE
ncbi:hypothetical protein Tco_0872248 [Tanacetum coccineum]